MKKFNFVSQASYATLFVASLFAASSAIAAAPPYLPPLEFRDYEYCEFLVNIPSAPAGSTRPIFNTTGWDSCSTWQALNTTDIMNAYNTQYPANNPTVLPNGATSVTINYPRAWVYDDAIQATPDTDLYLIADNITSGFDAFNTTSSQGIYTPGIVARTTTWIYDSNKLIYELIDPNKNTYVMQSYAKFIDTSLTYADLQSIAYMVPRLDLPTGWIYQVLELTQKFDNIANNDAQVMQDKLGNSYMLVNPIDSTLPIGTLRATSAPVPGPLPIFGVGMAFGFCRRLRARIKKSL